MRKSLLLVRSNVRRAKGQTAAIIVLIFLSAVMLNLWLMLSMDYKQNFERCHERLNEGHVTLAVDGNGSEMKDFLKRTVQEDERTESFGIDSAMHMVGLFEFNGGEVNSEFIFFLFFNCIQAESICPSCINRRR